MQKQKYRDLRKHYSRPRKNTIQKPERLYAKYVRLSLSFQIDQIYGFWISNLFSHPTPLFIAFLNLHNFNLFTKMPPLKGEVGLGVKWPFYPLAF
jgi:hypothetical protein